MPGGILFAGNVFNFTSNFIYGIPSFILPG